MKQRFLRRWFPIAAIVGLAAFTPGDARGEDAERPARRYFISAQAGYEAAFGSVTVSGGDASASTTVEYKGTQKVPLTIGAGGRLSPHVMLGGYLRLATILGKEVDFGESLGVALNVLPAPRASTKVLLGIGVGVQRVGAAGILLGPEIVPQVTVAFPLSPGFVLGPYAETSFVHYSASESLCADCSGWSTWGSLGLRALWI